LLNSYSQGGFASANNSIKINAVSGNILKNYRKSFFKRFKLDSPLAKELFDEDMPHLSRRVWTNYGYTDGGYNKEEKRPVTIVQMMMCGELEVLAEIMWQDDFDKMFE
jgi:hypothetical protein